MLFNNSTKEFFFVKQNARKVTANRNTVTILTAILISPQNAVAIHISKYEKVRLIPLASLRNSLSYKAEIETSIIAAKIIQKITANSYKLYACMF